jgi:DNA-binding XRE family transcriptional regulator
MVLLGNCHRTIRSTQRPQNKDFLLRKPLPANPISFGEKLRNARVARGYTQAELAKEFGVSFSTIKYWEQDRTRPMPTLYGRVECFINRMSSS